MILSLKDYQYLASKVEYNKETGSLKWLRREATSSGTIVFNTKYAGRECGTNNGSGYVQINVMSYGRLVKVRAHRLAWFIVNGKLPDGEIDHIDGNRSNNKILNLRDVSTAINQRNSKMRSTNTSGVTGVSWNGKKQKWEAHAKLNDKKCHIGWFSSKDRATEAVQSFRAGNGFTERHGMPLTPNSMR